MNNSQKKKRSKQIKHRPGTLERQALKRKVRKSPEWAELRQLKFNEQNGVDPITLRPLTKGWALHHMDLREEHYDNLNPERFLAVSHTHHEMLHWGFNIYKRTKSFDFLDILKEEILNMYKYSED